MKAVMKLILFAAVNTTDNLCIDLSVAADIRNATKINKADLSYTGVRSFERLNPLKTMNTEHILGNFLFISSFGEDHKEDHKSLTVHADLSI